MSEVTSDLAALTLAGGMTAATGAWSVANAATSACGSTCVSLYTESYGSADLLAVEGGLIVKGDTLDTVLSPAAPVPAEDWGGQRLGTAAQLYQLGLVSAAVGTTWPSAIAFQWVWAPNGRMTDQCLGVGTTAAIWTPVTLQPCGTPLNTVWVVVQSLSNTLFSRRSPAGPIPAPASRTS